MSCAGSVLSDHASDSDHVSRLQAHSEKCGAVFGKNARKNKEVKRLFESYQTQTALKAARFPIHRDLTAFDWSDPPWTVPASNNWPRGIIWKRRQPDPGWPNRHRQNRFCHRTRRRRPSSRQAHTLLQRRRSGQSTGAGKSSGQSRESGQAAHPVWRVRQKNDPPDRFLACLTPR